MKNTSKKVSKSKKTSAKRKSSVQELAYVPPFAVVTVHFGENNICQRTFDKTIDNLRREVKRLFKTAHKAFVEFRDGRTAEYSF